MIVQVKSQGTRVLCNLSHHTILDIVGPVGRGFVLSKDAKRVAVVGGGIGVAPLRYLIERYPKVQFHSLLGFKSKKYIYQSQIFNKISNLHIHTDDGSTGTKGFAINTLDIMLSGQKFDAVYACGPTPMFKALKDMMDKHADIPCYISMEERMGCGIGGCKVCVCKTIDNGVENYKTVCQDGPVFDIRKVVL